MLRRLDVDGRTSRYHFDSLAELQRYIADTPKAPRWRNKNSSGGKSQGMNWDLGASWHDACNMARDGWLEGAQRAAKALKAFVPATPEPTKYYSVAGHRVQASRYAADNPRCMVRQRSTLTGGGKVLSLYVPVNALADVSAKHMANFGVGVAQYVNQLETEGRRVDLYGVISSNVGGVRVTHSWQLKRADQPLDLAVIAFSIGHPAMFRRLGFGLRERLTEAYDSGYGSTANVTLDELINPPAGAVVLNGMKDADRHARTPEQALEYITRQIDKAVQLQFAD